MGLGGFFRNIRYNLQRVMAGRNGFDALSMALLAVAVIASVAARLSGLYWLMAFYFAGFLLCFFRAFSRNLYKRQRENARFLSVFRGIAARFRLWKRMFRERKTHRYFSCPSCKQHLRVPKGKGKISIRCSKCGQEMIRNV